jgi:hypothetical protein
MTSLTAPARRYCTALRYTDRLSKAPYIADKYREILAASVLDVGCDRKQLQRCLAAGVRYHGVDIGPDADTSINLDRERLPFPARSFDTVLAADVLEHLDNLHSVFDSLCEIARRHVIVALPNPLRNLVLALLSGSGGALKHYGLPVEPPRDRHRWFFGFDDAVQFLRTRAEHRGFHVEQIDVTEHGTPPLLDISGRNVLDCQNIRMGTLWCVLARAGEA